MQLYETTSVSCSGLRAELAGLPLWTKSRHQSRFTLLARQEPSRIRGLSLVETPTRLKNVAIYARIAFPIAQGAARLGGRPTVDVKRCHHARRVHVVPLITLSNGSIHGGKTHARAFVAGCVAPST